MSSRAARRGKKMPQGSEAARIKAQGRSENDSHPLVTLLNLLAAPLGLVAVVLWVSHVYGGR
jgi:uncharacterized membrane protein